MKEQKLNGRVRVTDGPRTRRKYPTKRSKIRCINTLCQNAPAPGPKSCQHYLDQSGQQLDEAGKIHGQPKKKRAKTNDSHEEQPHISKTQLKDENQEVEDEDFDSEKRREILVGHPPWFNAFQESKNGGIIQRELYKSKSDCDAVYRLDLQMDRRPPPKSWIEHNKMHSFDEQSMSLQKHISINKPSTNKVIGRKKNKCILSLKFDGS